MRRLCRINEFCRQTFKMANTPSCHVTPWAGVKTESKTQPYSGPPISRYPTTNVKDLPVHVQERMYKLDDKVGFIPNLFHAFAHRPEEFMCYLEFHDTITRRSKLSRAERELVGIAASSYNKCVYCVVSHSALHRLSSNNPTLADEVAVNANSPALNPRQRAIVDFTLAITRNESVTEEQLASLAKHGVDREGAWDIAAFASLTAFINRMTTFLEVRPNQEFFTMGRIKE